MWVCKHKLLLLSLKGARISNERVCDVIWICNKYFRQTIHSEHSCNLIKIAFITTPKRCGEIYIKYLCIHTNQHANSTKIYIHNFLTAEKTTGVVITENHGICQYYSGFSEWVGGCNAKLQHSRIDYKIRRYVSNGDPKR